MKGAIIPLCFLMQMLRGEPTGIYFVDSTRIVCHIKREKQHRVFKGIAKKAKSSIGWFYGFKLHLVINDKGEIMTFKLTIGNVDGRKPEPEKAIERPAKEGSWDEGLSELKISKAHWQKMLEFAKRGGNPQTIAGMEAIVSECRRKLNLHLLEKEKFATEDKISPEMAASIGSHSSSANLYYSAVMNG